jgi:cysteine-rich repeat protein
MMNFGSIRAHIRTLTPLTYTPEMLGSSGIVIHMVGVFGRIAPLLFLVWASGCGEVLDPVCGNGVIEATEECDDGDTDGSDDCTASCKRAACGDGFVNVAGAIPEACDDGNAVDNDDCSSSCQLARCGDGVVNSAATTPEGCDDANAVDNDDCTNACNVATCGDNIVHNAGTGTETCDPPGTSCSAACARLCPARSTSMQAGPYVQYGFCWYLGNDALTCDAVCASISGTNLANSAATLWADACGGALAADITTYFLNNGNPGGWTGTGGTSYHTLGYGYRGSLYYGKCASGTANDNGAFPGDTNSNATRSLVCPCAVAP